MTPIIIKIGLINDNVAFELSVNEAYDKFGVSIVDIDEGIKHSLSELFPNREHAREYIINLIMN